MKALFTITLNTIFGFVLAVTLFGLMGFDTPIDTGEAVISVILCIGINIMLITNGEYDDNAIR